MAASDSTAPTRQLAELLERSTHITTRDVAGTPVDHPLELGPMHRTQGDGIIDHLANIHPDDRQHAASAWARAMHAPTSLVTTNVRIHEGGFWYPFELCYLNLLGDPGYGVMVTGVARLSDAGEEATVVERGGATDAAWALLKIGPTGEVLAAEGLVERLYGWKPEELVGRNGLDCVHPEDHAALLDAWCEVVKRKPGGRALRQRVLRRDGTATWVQTSLGQPEPDGPIYVHDLDITEQLAAERALEASEERVRRLAEELPTPVMVCRTSGDVVYSSTRVRDLAGFAPQHIGQLLDPQAQRRWAEEVATARSYAGFELESWLPGDRVLSVRVGPRQPDSRMIVAVEDVSASHRWRVEAHRDALTGLLNARGVHAGFSDRDPDAETVLAFIDLDGFKSVNDTHGHPTGDRMLCKVADALRAATRPTDLVGRCGGDEFVVLTEVPPGTEEHFEERLREQLARVEVDGVRLGGASIGWTRVRRAEPLLEAIERADEAMYSAKRRETDLGANPARTPSGH